MGIGFKGGFAAFMDGYSRAEQQRGARERQEKEDAWMQSQRDAKLAEQKREDELRTKLSTLSPKVTEDVDNFVMAPDATGAVPVVKMERTKTQAEQVDDLSDAYQGHDPAKALELKAKADALRAQDYQNKFIQFRANASGMGLKEQVEAARKIFNDAPNPGMIGEPTWNEDGSVSFEAVNKATGQTVRKTLKDPAKLVDDIHAFISPQSYQAEQAAKTARAQKLEDEKAKALTERDKFVWQEGVKAKFRNHGLGGSGKPEKPIGPAIETVKTDTGSYLYDKNSGAVGTIIPATDAIPAQSSWFGADKPETPASPNRVEWRSADGQPLPGGPQTLYSQLPVNNQKNKPGASPAPQKPSAPTNSWNDATGEVISNGKVIGRAKSVEEAKALLRGAK